ncbi:MAG: putative methylamine utilization protein MauG [Myxococcales bacterium]|nr:putative methylamine utilization protein MauG [Myxococcales bacterium]
MKTLMRTVRCHRPTLVALVKTGTALLILGPLGCGNSNTTRQGPEIPQPTMCQQVNIGSILPGGANIDPDVVQINASISATEAAALAQATTSASLDFYHQITLLGKIEIYDVNLSVNKNVACATCHVPDAGFTGGSSFINQTIVAQPGSVAITNATGMGPNARVSARKPQTYSYAPFAPILHYNATQQDFYGGNFWDMRATGIRLDNGAAEQAQGPPVNPLEMGLPDTTCAVYRVSQGPYRAFFEQIWGTQSFAINWPANIAQLCSTPSSASVPAGTTLPPQNGTLPVPLSDLDRGRSNDTYDNMVLAIASYEAGPEVSPFSSKFDFFLAGAAQLTAQEQNGWALFHGKAHCNECHLDGTEANAPGKVTPADVAPLFSDFTSNNIGVPANPCLPFLFEDVPDQTGFVANPTGPTFVDLGVGAFLSSDVNANPSLRLNPNPSEWGPLAPKFNGKFQVPTLRNVDKRPRPDFVKAYMHNGYMKSLKEVVHFYNTSQSLPRCAQGSAGEKTTCWPPPEVASNLNTTQLGNLGLTDSEENDIIAFLQTLTDGFM